VDGLFRDVGDRLRSDLLRAKVVDGNGAPDVRIERELQTDSNKHKVQCFSLFIGDFMALTLRRLVFNFYSFYMKNRAIFSLLVCNKY